MVRKGVLPCAGRARGCRPRVPPTGAAHGAWVCWCRVSASGGARPPDGSGAVLFVVPAVSF